MLSKKRFALNRIIAPTLGLKDFFTFTAHLGLSKVELRNDLPGKSTIKDIVDAIKPVEVLKMAQDMGIRIITINALQKFNLAGMRTSRLEELERLLELAAAIDCKALVLCPNNDGEDKRPPKQQYQETVEALEVYGPLFVTYGIAGYIEALGFPVSSLASLPVIVNAIKASGFGCYRVLFDTFHHFIGPDNEHIFGMDGMGASYDVLYTGLVHISGVEDHIPIDAYRDAHRVLINAKDRMKNREIIKRLNSFGYQGTFSFEPFSETVQKLSPNELAIAIESSFEYLEVQ